MAVTLEADDDFKLLLVGFLRCFDYFIEAVSVNADRLLHKYVFALGDGVFEVHRAKAGRSGNTD